MRKLRRIKEAFKLDDYQFIGWGRKKSGSIAQKLSRKSKYKHCLLEDGFFSYIERSNMPLSIVVDFDGIYYDANSLSSLFYYIEQPIDKELFNHASIIIDKINEMKISKYNQWREYKNHLRCKYVLVVDQTFGDLSVNLGRANKGSFQKMLKSALDDNPHHQIYLKVHPDFFISKKESYFNIPEIQRNNRITIINHPCHPTDLIKGADSVYVVTSQIGFEALILKKKVKCFGMPFYAGWGLTDDDFAAFKRRKNVSLEQLVYAALVKYPIYRDPETNERTTVMKTIEYIQFQRNIRFRFPETLYAFGFTLWKKSILKSFTQGSELIFINRFENVPPKATVLVWGSQNCDGLDKSVNLIRVEDGFLRSVGLGGDLIRPQSWVFDNMGIYYDSSKPSQLETILNNTEFESEELVRAKHLIGKLNVHRISKYNLGDSQLEIKNEKKKAILVVGQVEKDASIRFGTGAVNTNLKLLQSVRKKFPEAYIIYKPHPDVVAGIRKKGENKVLEKKYYDLKVESGDALALFDSIDSVHTMTSLVGFEALLRNKKVYTYGQPFYAGWGLTIDLMPIERRCRQLSLEELVAGSLIRYPTYVSRTSKMYTSPEKVVEELIQQKEKGFQRMPLWRKFIRDLVKIWTHSNLRPNA